MSEILKIDNLGVEISTDSGIGHALRGVSLSLKKGEIHGMVGESGCGKTVTAKSILRLHDEKTVRYTGKIFYEGRDLLSVKEKEMRTYRGKKIAYVFQNPMTSFDNLFTVGEQIAETVREHTGISKKEARERAVELLKKVGVTPAEKRAKQYPYEFSGGMLQRAMIAMAISCNPEILIADEATTALDVTMQARILRLISKLRDETNLSVLCITHNLGVVAEICDTVSVMYGGRVVEEGCVRDIFHHPKHPYTRELIAHLTDSVSGGGEAPSLLPTPPEITEEIRGCIYAKRCSQAEAFCFHISPEKNDGSEAHFAACHKISEV